ncbi:hypothetical protein vBAspATola_11 [Aeromonas phage vB_AspA_Tola]|nr:hypothetical protein vBAspATola_11 [Aeromonas phage vB_AspA_Tola]
MNHTREWAIARMKDGKRVTHHNFTPNEYLHMQGNSVMTEDGYRFDDILHGTSWMANGWSIHKSSN